MSGNDAFLLHVHQQPSVHCDLLPGAAAALSSSGAWEPQLASCHTAQACATLGASAQRQAVKVVVAWHLVYFEAARCHLDNLVSLRGCQLSQLTLDNGISLDQAFLLALLL